MRVCFTFFDKEYWSIYATLNTIITLLLFILSKQQLTIQLLTLSSLLSMMKGNILSKLIFVFFLSILTIHNHNYLQNTFILIISTIVIHHIPYNNYIQKNIYNKNYLKILFRIVIFLWICFYIVYIRSKLKFE